MMAACWCLLNYQKPHQQPVMINSVVSVDRRNTVMNDNDVSKFTCKKCGGHRMIVTHVWTILAGTDSERWQEWGPLKDDHHWQYEFKEKIEENTDEEVQRGDFGEFEEDDSASEPEEYEIYETETSRESDEFFVNCENCDREIEFGWSQPDRRGLIWPVEFSDFMPAENWPDPKYTDVWQRRKWLHAGSIRS
jgi:hypothetical protein